MNSKNSYRNCHEIINQMSLYIKGNLFEALYFYGAKKVPNFTPIRISRPLRNSHLRIWGEMFFPESTVHNMFSSIPLHPWEILVTLPCGGMDVFLNYSTQRTPLLRNSLFFWNIWIAWILFSNRYVKCSGIVIPRFLLFGWKTCHLKTTTSLSHMVRKLTMLLHCGLESYALGVW